MHYYPQLFADEHCRGLLELGEVVGTERLTGQYKISVHRQVIVQSCWMGREDIG